MKNKFLLSQMAVIVAGMLQSVIAYSQSANTTLSNLVSPTSVNQSLTPSLNNSKNLGSSTLAWKDGWFAGKVCIGGTVAPAMKLHLKETSSSTNEVLRIEGFDPLIQFYEGGLMGYLRVLDGDLFLATNSSNDQGNLRFGTQSAVHMNISPVGDVSIGTTVESGKLYVRSDGDLSYPQFHLQETTINESARLRFSTTTGIIGDESAWDISALNSPTSGNDYLRIQRLNESGVTATHLLITESGNVGIGALAPAVKLHLLGTNEILRLDGTTPYMTFYNSGVEKSYIQQLASDFRLGTSSTNSTGKVQITAGSSTVMTMTTAGKVGVGTTAPSVKMHLKGSGELLRLEGADGQLQFYNGSLKGYMRIQGNDILVGTNGGNTTGDVLLYTNGNMQMMINETGQIGMGTFTPKTGYKLSVEGKIACRELKVESATWPDYVFENDFQLMPLTEVENYITQYKHLPGIPAASEIVENGVELGDMQVKLMEKIEQLTLYVIELDKTNRKLQEQLQSLKN